VVYKAVHKASKDIRAVKLIEKASVSPDKQTKLFQEIAILKKLVLSDRIMLRTIPTS
jgi:hypothetical protein